MITLKNVSFSYFSGGTPAVNDITTQIGPGVHLLLGENGAGKTTLLKLLDGLRVPQSGEIIFNDTDIARFRHLPSVLSHFAYLDNDMMLPGGTIENAAHSHAQFYPNFDPDLLRRNLEAFGISPVVSLRNLSMGNLRKAQMAYILSLRATVTLLDEPTNGMDIESKQILQRILAESITDEQTVIVSTHNFADLQNMYDALIVINRGKLILNTSIDRMLDRIVFATTQLEPADALYWELSGGLYHAIFEADSEEPGLVGDVDFRLLYSALHSPYAASILRCINSETETPVTENPENSEKNEI